MMIRRTAAKGLLLCAVSAFSLSTCAGDGFSQTAPGWPGEEWPVSTPAEVGIDPEAIDALVADIEAGTYGYSEVSGLPIQRERLEAIPETTVLAAEKVSGVGPR